MQMNIKELEGDMENDSASNSSRRDLAVVLECSSLSITSNVVFCC
jgi:hypothetical protein